MAIDPARVCARILELGETDDYLGILNLAASSPEGYLKSDATQPQLRKYYLKLSLIAHPDRVGKAFPDATKAFQTLVRAYESLTAPELIEEVETGAKGKKDGGKKQGTAIARSNEGCFRTRVCCPRCKQPWNEGTLDGNPDYCYNFLMTGLKQYMCSTCLCEFGCMTAIHKCPFCVKSFEYVPSDYHKKITCGHSGCKKEFGFWMYHASDRVIKEMKASVKAEQERLAKAREAKLRRAKRSSGLDSATAESAFLLGLSDVCPRCGEDFAEVATEEEQIRHLMECTDEGKHKAFCAKKKKESAKKEQKEKLQEAQAAAQTQAAWDFLGANTTQLWLLNEDQLRSKALQLGADTSGDKDDLINSIVNLSGAGSAASRAGKGRARIAGSGSGGGDSPETKVGRKRKSAKEGSEDALVATSPGQHAAKGSANSRGGGASSAVVSKRAREAAAAQELPSDLQAYSAAQLRSMCAAQGLLGVLPKNAVKADMLRVLETTVFEIEDSD